MSVNRWQTLLCLSMAFSTASWAQQIANPNTESESGLGGISDALNDVDQGVGNDFPDSLNEPGGDTPLVFDWNRDGIINVTSQDKGALVDFDITHSGSKRPTDWIARGEAFLAIDLTGNGLIESGAELFGNATIINGSGLRAANGFEALAQYDDNGDGLIDRQDRVFERLLIWQDKNRNGISEPEELTRLKQTDVAYIRLKYTDVSFSEGLLPNSRSAVRQTSTYGVIGDENEHLFVDVYFNVLIDVSKTKANAAHTSEVK